MITTEVINQAIEILKKSDQTLVFADSLICPVRQLVGKSIRDEKMKMLADHLKEINVIESYCGFASLAGPGPWYLYIGSFTLTEGFFKEHRKPIYKQIQLTLQF